MMSNKRIFTEVQKKKLNELYLNYLQTCFEKQVQPKWPSFHNDLKKKAPELPSLTPKQLINKITDYRKMHGCDLWPTFQYYKELQNGVLYKRLFERSENSFFLAIEIYNRIKQNNKIEAFCILIINAWELLLKGFLVKEEGEQSIYYKDSPERTITIIDALKRVIVNENDLVRKNLEKMIEMRDQATHFLIPEIQPWLSRLFQSSIFNFIKKYEELTNNKIDFSNETGLITLILDKNNFSETIVEKNYGISTKDIVLKFIKTLDEEEAKYNNPEFIIPVEYKLVLTKNEQNGDIKLQSGTLSSVHTQGVIIEVAKDPDRTHPYLSKEVIDRVNKELSDKQIMPINQYSLQAIIYKEKIKANKSSQYYYMLSRPQTHRYSQQFVDLIVKKSSQHQNYIEGCMDSYKEFLDKRRKQKSKEI